MKDSADSKTRPRIARKAGDADFLDQTVNRSREEGDVTEFALLRVNCDGAGR